MIVGKTIPKMFFSTAESHPDKTALAIKESGEWKTITYAQLGEKVSVFSKALYSLGIRRGDKVALILGNSPEWVVSDLAILSLGAADVPLYATLGDEQARHILIDSGAKAVVVSGKDQLDKLRRIIYKLHNVSFVITVDEGVERVGNLRTLTFSSTIKMGAEVGGQEEKKVAESFDNIKDDDIASIIYTSGTTGLPKGVMLTHRNFMSNIEGILDAVEIGHNDRHLSFLPLSHVFERTAGHNLFLAVGGEIYYAESLDKIGDNIKEITPTIVISVPRLFEKMIAKIKDKVSNAPAIRQKLFHWAMDVGERATDSNNPGRNSLGLRIQFAIANKLVYTKLQQAFGGRIRFFVSGGAALSKDVSLFFRAVGIKVLEGYGLTETSPVIAVNREDDIRIGAVGRVLDNVEVKFLEDGELLVKGPSVAKGYYNNPSATKEAFDKDGWCHTGDIANLDDGYLSIADRKKDMIVMSNGKNVPPLTIESKLVGNDFIAQALVIGNNRKFISALIVPDFVRLKRDTADLDIDDALDNDQLVENTHVQALYKKKIDDLLKDFARFEQIKEFVLLPEEFTEAGGELTPTLKIKRKIVGEKYAKEIESIYAEPVNPDPDIKM